MSEVQKQPQVPDTMAYTDEERALARSKQQELADVKKRKRNRVVASIAGGAVLLAGGAVAGMKFAGGDNAPTKERSPAASAPANPGETKTQEKPAEFGISTAEFQNNPEQLGQEFISQLNEYFIAGATEEAANADDRFDVTNDEYVANLSAPIDAKFIDSLLVEGWESNPNLVDFVNANTYVANITRRVRLETYSGGTEDKEPYVRETIIDSVEGTTDPLTTSIRWHEHDNRDMNTAEEVLTGVDPNQETGGETITWTDVDGQLRISDISHYDG